MCLHVCDACECVNIKILKPFSVCMCDMCQRMYVCVLKKDAYILVFVCEVHEPYL